MEENHDLKSMTEEDLKALLDDAVEYDPTLLTISCDSGAGVGYLHCGLKA